MIVGRRICSHTVRTDRGEEAYRLALEMVPRNTDAIISLSQHFASTGRPEAARELVTDFGRRNPDLKPDLDRILPQYKVVPSGSWRRLE
jgi:hypothetical protein